MIPFRFCLVLCLPCPRRFQVSAAAQQPITWVMPNEYPATLDPRRGRPVLRRPGERRSRRGAIVHHPPVRSRERPALSRDNARGRRHRQRCRSPTCFGRRASASASRLFLPGRRYRSSRVTTDQGAARRCSRAPRRPTSACSPSTTKKLLYPSPWPPTGIWGQAADERAPRRSKACASATYDVNGTVTFKALGAAPEQISFTDAVKKLTSGEIQAVLSSGDGGAGRAAVGTIFDHFTADQLRHVPLSMVTINLDVWKQLSPTLQRGRARPAASARPRRVSGPRSARAASMPTTRA